MVEQARQGGKRVSSVSRLGGAFAAFVLFALLLAAPAFAGFEQVGHFAENELEGASFAGNIAVNTTGAGGTPAGTFYVPGRGVGSGGSYGVDSYGARGEFLGKDNGLSPRALAVDQTTGFLYLLSESLPHEIIKVYSADGSKLITAFGDHAAAGETFEQSPEKIHIQVTDLDGIAVDAAGTVYVSDHANTGESRVMVFKPQSPGDYEHYVYAGRANDISTFGRLAVDDAGDLYSDDEGGGVLEFAPGQPSTPICRYEAPGLNLSAMTVNPVTGEVFFFNTHTPKVVHQLSPCSEGVFKEAGVIETVPTPHEGLSALGFNPVFDWEASRPSGVLYGVSGDGKGFGYIFAPAEVRFPVIESQWVSTVTATTATLNSEIDPKGSNTDYVFQYLTGVAYEANQPAERFAGASEAPVGSATLPAGQKGEHAAASLLGLQSDTEYRYRVIATSHCEPEHPEALCKETGQDQAFRTYPAEAPGLPDGRAWELVSPALKSGGEVFPLEPNQTGSAPACHSSGSCNPGKTGIAFPRQSSPDGETVAYEGFPFSSTEGAAILNQYVSRRTASGWQTTTLEPSLFSNSGRYAGFDAALTEGVLVQGFPSLTPQAPFEFANLYTQPTASPASLGALIAAQPPDRPLSSEASGFAVRYASASADLSHIFFEANDALTPATPVAPAALDGGPNEYNLYEWAAGQLRLVNVAPGNLETTPGKEGGGGGDRASAVSADGSHVFWSGSTGQVYVRIDAAETREIKDPGKFLAASTDGSRVLLDDGCLYDLQAEHCEDLTEDQTNVHQGGFQGVAGYSDDLSHVYFADTAVLTGEGENSEGVKAQAGQDNIYARDTNAGTTTFVATLLPGDSPFAEEGDWGTLPQRRTAEASPGGRWLAFRSGAPLTGYDNVGPTCGMTSVQKYVAGHCSEAFLYDAVTGKLRCVSCNPGGARPLGRTTFPVINSSVVSRQPRYLTDSGRLYFNSQDSLSPLDTNRAVEEPDNIGEPSGSGAAGAEDVYEYEPGGVGSCTRPGGCVSLVSSGNESLDASFLATDATGRNVFFTTRERLVSRDTDDLMDVYDAREGGGFSAESESGRGECQGEACQSPVQAPNDQTPSSAAFEGPGNLVASIKPPPPPPPASVKALTRAQKLARALRVCRSEPKRKRARCQARARKRYAAKKAARQTSHKRRAGR
jgi:hypothetical protein